MMIELAGYHQLRLYDENQADGAPTLAEFFDSQCLPNWLQNRQQKPRDPKTIAKYQDVLRHWSKCCAYRREGPPVELAELPVDQIEDWHVDEFCRYLRETAAGRKQRNLAPQTIENYEKTLLAILSRLGPQVSPRRWSAGYLDCAPYFYVSPAASSPGHKEPSPWSTDEATKMVAAAHKRTGRRKVGGVRRDLFWVAILKVAYYTGLRIRPITLMRFDHITRRTEGGAYLSVPIGNDKFGKPHKTFLHPQALAAIEDIRSQRPFVFPWSSAQQAHPIKASHARRSLNASLNRLIKTARIDKANRKPWHGFRFLHHSTLSMIDPYAASLSLNHGSSVGELHYLNKADRIAGAILQMPSI